MISVGRPAEPGTEISALLNRAHVLAPPGQPFVTRWPGVRQNGTGPTCARHRLGAHSWRIRHKRAPRSIIELRARAASPWLRLANFATVLAGRRPVAPLAPIWRALVRQQPTVCVCNFARLSRAAAIYPAGSCQLGSRLEDAPSPPRLCASCRWADMQIGQQHRVGQTRARHLITLASCVWPRHSVSPVVVGARV